MRKLTAKQQKHAAAINSLMFSTLQRYIARYTTNEDDVRFLHMYAKDVAYNAAALTRFNETFDFAELHNAIALQDTAVREFYIDTLRYLEKNKLVHADEFICA